MEREVKTNLVERMTSDDAPIRKACALTHTLILSEIMMREQAGMFITHWSSPNLSFCD